MTHNNFTVALLIRYTPLSWQIRHGWHKTNWNCMTITHTSNGTTFPKAQSTSLRVGSANIPVTTCVRKLGYMIADNISQQAHFKCLSFYLRWNQTNQLCQNNRNSRLCLCSLQVRLLSFSSVWLPTLHSQKATESSDCCRETGFQITQAWSCATSSLSSSFATGPSQNRLQILSYLSQLLLWLAPFFSTLTFSLFTHLPDSFVFCRHTDTSHPQR